jgi:hypothetical protein
VIDYKEAKTLIVKGLQEWLESKGHKCPVARANQTAPMPSYPYISFTIPNPLVSSQDGYSVMDDGTRCKQMVQTWSFTVQGDDEDTVQEIALLAYDWFSLTGNTFLSDNNIVAQRVGNITNRDNLLTIEYEYRRGFDVDFLLIQKLEKADGEAAGYIETADITMNEEV